MKETKTLDYDLEIKAVTDTGQVEGWAARYGNVDHGGDVIEPGAFKGLDGRPVPMLWGHDTMQPIGVWDEFKDAPGGRRGLFAKGRMFPEDDPLARRILNLVKHKAVNGMSIGYKIPPGGSEMDENRPGVRRLKSIDLVEVSLVTLPMNDQARITSVKAILDAGHKPTVREFEDFLRKSGFSKSLATAIASKAAPVLRGEPDEKANEPIDFLEALVRKLKAG